jgi:hypothetical protein
MNDPKPNAVQWFRKALSDIRKLKIGKSTDYQPLLTDRTRTPFKKLKGQVLIFGYKPNKKTKFYDRYPLVLVLDVRGTQLLGLNLHYIPPADRIKLILLMNSALYNQKETNLQKTRIRLFSILTKKIFNKYLGTVLNKYEMKNIIGKPKLTSPEEWSYLAFLPVFKGISPSKLYSLIRKKVNEYEI